MLWDNPLASATGIEAPVIVDVDNDCVAEILVTGCAATGPGNRLEVWQCESSETPRAIWNQYAYHTTNVDGDGTIPRFEAAPWTARVGWLAQIGGAAIIPGDLGNSLRAVERPGNVWLSWASHPEARSYSLHRGIVKGAWPAPPYRSGLAAPTDRTPDLAAPPSLYFYRASEANCSGVDGP